MSNLISLNDYREKRQQLELVHFIPLAEGVPTGKVLIPIENAGRNLGLLVASYHGACANCGDHVAEHALYVRYSEEDHKEKYNSTEFLRLYFTRQGQLYTVETKQKITPPSVIPTHLSSATGNTILPLPSQYPYVACELPAIQYFSLKEKLIHSRQRHRRVGLEQAVDILAERAERTGFAQRQTGNWWWKKKQLITPEGYADRVSEGPEMVEKGKT